MTKRIASRVSIAAVCIIIAMTAPAFAILHLLPDFVKVIEIGGRGTDTIDQIMKTLPQTDANTTGKGAFLLYVGEFVQSVDAQCHFLEAEKITAISEFVSKMTNLNNDVAVSEESKNAGRLDGGGYALNHHCSSDKVSTILKVWSQFLLGAAHKLER